MADDYLKKLEELRLSLMSTLQKTNSLILREKRMQNEDLSTETGSLDDSALPLHSEVESPNQSKPTPNRRSRRRRRALCLPDSNCYRERRISPTTLEPTQRHIRPLVLCR